CPGSRHPAARRPAASNRGPVGNRPQPGGRRRRTERKGTEVIGWSYAPRNMTTERLVKLEVFLEPAQELFEPVKIDVSLGVGKLSRQNQPEEQNPRGAGTTPVPLFSQEHDCQISRGNQHQPAQRQPL